VNLKFEGGASRRPRGYTIAPASPTCTGPGRRLQHGLHESAILLTGGCVRCSPGFRVADAVRALADAGQPHQCPRDAVTPPESGDIRGGAAARGLSQNVDAAPRCASKRPHFVSKWIECIHAPPFPHHKFVLHAALSNASNSGIEPSIGLHAHAQSIHAPSCAPTTAAASQPSQPNRGGHGEGGRLGSRLRNFLSAYAAVTAPSSRSSGVPDQAHDHVRVARCPAANRRHRATGCRTGKR
jgi:hypothetical protein